MVEIWTKVVSLLLVPPGILIIGALMGFLIQIRWVIAGSFILLLNILALFVLSLPVTAYHLTDPLEAQYAPLPQPLVGGTSSPPEAIVVLGAGRYTNAAEYGGGDAVNRLGLERLRYGVYLHRQTKLPILVTGGTPFGETVSEAALMQHALTQDFQTPAQWVEDQSATTQANAVYTKQTLAAAGIRRIYLVTHASHMPRAVWAFENAGLIVTPAPMSFSTRSKSDLGILGYLPTARGLNLSSQALNEQLGMMWYQHKYRVSAAARKSSPAAAP